MIIRKNIKKKERRRIYTTNSKTNLHKQED